MYGSQAMSKDLNLPFPASPFRLAKDEIDLTHHPNHQHGHHHQQQEQHQQQQQQQQHMGSGGFLRYRSVPNTVMGDLCEEFLPNRAPAAEEESMYARFMAPDLRDLLGDKQGSTAAPPVPPSEVAPPHMLFQLHQHRHQQPPPQPSSTLPNISCSTTVAATAGENLFRPMGSIGMEQQQEHPKGGGSSSLIRHSSSPAGLFSHLHVENGFVSMSSAADPSGSASSSSSRLKGPQLGFSPRPGTSFMSQISEMGSDGLGGSPEEEDGSGGGAAAARCYIPGYPVVSWDESASVLLGDGLQHGGRRPRDPSELQSGEMRGHPHLAGGGLAHHLSLPAPGRAADMASVERFLQFQDAVPCKLRAKRGCATHPRSIAERVRRTRISERMRKLQELVPNMDKQTNTADMLDLAVEYIKELERQAKALSESRANCTCSASSGHHHNHQ